MDFTKITASVLAVSIMLALAGCSNDPKHTSSDEVSSTVLTESVAESVGDTSSNEDMIEIVPTETILAVGECASLTANYTGSKGLYWNSSDMNIAKVNASGEVTAVATGSVTITVTDKTDIGSITLTVVETPAEKAAVSIETKPIENPAAPNTPTETQPSTKPTASNTAPTETQPTTKPTVPNTAPTESQPTTKPNTAPTETQPSTKPTTPNTAPTETQPPTNPTTTVATLKITTGSFSLEVGKTKTMTYSYTGSKSLSWYSSDSSIASVSNGVVTACNPGTAVISITDGKLTSQVTVTVVTKYATLTISTSQFTLNVGQSTRLTYTYTGTGTVRYENEFGNASVDQSGNITALSKGTEYIYVTDGTLTKCCTVNIVENTPLADRIEFDGASGPLSGTYYTGKTLSLMAIVYPNEANTKAIVSSSNNSVATVSCSYDGRCNNISVNFVGEGSVSITVTSADGNISRSASFDVKTYVPEIPSNELSPDQFANEVANAMARSGYQITSVEGAWRQLTVRNGQLTYTYADSVGNSIAREYYSSGYTLCNCYYQYQDGDGNYIFRIDIG